MKTLTITTTKNYNNSGHYILKIYHTAFALNIGWKVKLTAWISASPTISTISMF